MINDVLKNFALGTVQFGMDYGISNQKGQTPVNEVSEILKYAWSNGLSHLDTAYSYGNSESVLGKCMTNDFKVTTKFPFDDRIENIEKHFFESLIHLKRQGVYGLLTHEADSIIKQPIIWDLQNKLKLKGFTKKIGFSLYFPHELEKLLSLGFFPDIVQVPLNIIDQRFVPYFEELKSVGCEIHTRSAFLQGLFFMDPNQLSDFFIDIKPIINALKQFFPENKDLSAYLLTSCLSSGSDKVAIGVNNLVQLQNIVEGLYNPLKQIDLKINYSNINEKILLPFNWPK